MSDDMLVPQESMEVQMDMRALVADMLDPRGVYTMECVAEDGSVRWSEEIKNLVTDAGARDILDKYLSGSAYTPSLAIGITSGGTPANANTMASHAGWQEVGGANQPVYTGNRKVPAFSAASGRTKAMSAVAAFAITSTGPNTVGGLFLVNGGSTAKDDTTGVLVSVGLLSPGSRIVYSGDTINVTYSLSV